MKKEKPLPYELREAFIYRILAKIGNAQTDEEANAAHDLAGQIRRALDIASGDQ